MVTENKNLVDCTKNELLAVCKREKMPVGTSFSKTRLYSTIINTRSQRLGLKQAFREANDGAK